MSPKDKALVAVKDGNLIKPNIKKYSAMVHISGRPTLVQRKMWNAMFSKSEKDFFEKQVFEMKISDLCRDIGHESNRKNEYIKDNLMAIRKIEVDWNILGKGGTERWGNISLLSGVEYGHKPGWIRYEFPQMLKDKLLENKRMFALLSTKVMNSLKKQYSLVLYELAFDYKNIHETPWLELDIFKELMGIDKTPRYEQFKFINSEIIKPAMEEVNKKTNFRITVEFQRSSRSVSAVKFHVLEVKDEKTTLSLLQPTLFDDRNKPLDIHKDLVDKLLDLKFGIPEIKDLARDHDVDKVKDHIGYMEMQINIKSPKRFVIKSLQADYDLTDYYEKQKKNEKRLKTEEERARTKKQEQEEQREKKEREDAVNKWIEENKKDFESMVEELDLPRIRTKKIDSDLLQRGIRKNKKQGKETSEIEYVMGNSFMSYSARSKVLEIISKGKK